MQMNNIQHLCCVGIVNTQKKGYIQLYQSHRIDGNRIDGKHQTDFILHSPTTNQSGWNQIIHMVNGGGRWNVETVHMINEGIEPNNSHNK